MAEQFANYQTLQDNQIRLLKFDEIWLRTNKFSAILEHVNLDDAPIYYALSYVWGNVSKTKTILLNDHSFKVTKNLDAALLQIRDNAPYFQGMVQQDLGSPYTEFRLWVDAICINQSDHEEKAQQIPKMQPIYSSAHDVLIWLGPTKTTPHQPVGYARFMQESHAIHRIHAWFEMNTAPATNSDVFELHALAYTVFLILHLPWFGRLWTVQEYVLGRRSPLALLGSGVFALQTMRELIEVRLPDVFRDTTGDHRDKLYTALGVFKRKSVMLRLMAQLRDKIRSGEYRLWTFAEQMNYVLLRTLDKASSVPHDQIYGLLGLVDRAKIPANLGLNYKTSFGDVCQQYVKHIIDVTGNLNILFCMKNELSGYPSWVPDLRYRSPSAGPCGKPLTTATTSWSADGQRLTIEGVYLGQILAYSSYIPEDPNRVTQEQSRREGPNMDSQLIQFYDTILTASAWLRRQSLRETWDEWLSPYEQLNDCETDYVSMADFVAAGLDDKDKFSSTKFSERTMLLNIKQHFRTLNYGLMDNGGLLLCWPTVAYMAKERNLDIGNSRHLVWAMKGTDLLSILAQDGEDYRLLGFGVPTAGMILPIGNLDLDDEFFSGYETQRVTLF